MHSICCWLTKTPFLSSSFLGISNKQLFSQPHKLSFHSCSKNTHVSVCAKKSSQPLTDPYDDVVDEDDFLDDEELEDDEYSIEDNEPCVGDGEGGGGISLAGTSWDEEALAIAEEVTLTFEGDLGIYAFKTLLNNIIRVRIEKLSNMSGSPNIQDIEAFSKAYRVRLDEAEVSGSIPGNVSLEVSSPGLERIFKVPQDLERFKERNMYVKYVSTVAETGAPCECDGIFRLVSYDLETKCCTWGIADVRANREKAGKGRPLNKKQREWRLETPFETLKLVRNYPEF
ncbi:uncharacterized protein LOC108211223 [Daucus carota subsp. sativus]|uniref:uncharacterized protein LOC108211223 n=1 Tax=Daucus carota subsp. sativus TaxID=79200 RepID=UPI0007EF6C4D|nr:PREDICTED: uncharacterized protein LOC108211223 [Daucus carota subsp. sativus]